MNKLFGIDISHWQGDLSVSQARDERGVQFVIVKAAGADAGKYKDSKFEDYYAQCKSIGMPVGTYYYGNAKSVAEAQAEADHFLSVIAGKQFEYPVYYDVEGKMLENAKDTLTDIVIAFCEKCEQAGYFTGVYSSDSHFQSHVDDSQLQRFTHWVAKYSSNEPSTAHDMWQYGGGQNFIADKTICGQTVDQDFCYRDFPAEIKAAGLNGFSEGNSNGGTTENNDNTTGVSNPEGSTLELVERTMRGEFGDGDNRKNNLGSRYDEVQSFINHIYAASAEDLANEVISGTYGNGDTRKAVLGDRYSEVQAIVNGESAKEYYTIQSGDTLSAIASANDTTVDKLVSLNGISNPDLIYAGTTIRVR